jgi:hypothetical protein
MRKQLTLTLPTLLTSFILLQTKVLGQQQQRRQNVIINRHFLGDIFATSGKKTIYFLFLPPQVKKVTFLFNSHTSRFYRELFFVCFNMKTFGASNSFFFFIFFFEGNSFGDFYLPPPSYFY